MNDKKITHAARAMLKLINVGLFSIIWIAYYNDFTFETHSWQGACVVICIFYFVYAYLCDLYKAYRIATTSVSDIIVSQFISFGIPDLIMYSVSCISYHNYVNIFPGAFTVILQLVCTIIVVINIRHQLLKRVNKIESLVIFGHLVKPSNVDLFIEKMTNKYGHLYNMSAVIDEDTSQTEIEEAILKYDMVFLYEVSESNRRNIIKLCFENKKGFIFTPRIEDLICMGASPRYLIDTPMLKYDYSNDKTIYLGIKRTIDILVSLFVLVVSSPILLITALAIKIEDKGPVFFKQKRSTKDGREFEIVKFRSMVVDADKMGVRPTVKGDSRITKVGKFIRSTRIDELPQMLNILMGEMSLVGPRPERIEHVEQYAKECPEFNYRLKVKGGLTGYAQVYGKYNTSPYDKLRLDLYYIENQSLIMDFKLILLTIRTIFQKESTEGF